MRSHKQNMKQTRMLLTHVNCQVSRQADQHVFHSFVATQCWLTGAQKDFQGQTVVKVIHLEQRSPWA